MKIRKVLPVTLFLIASTMLFGGLLGYLTHTLYQLRKDKLERELFGPVSETFFAIQFNATGLEEYASEITVSSQKSPDEQAVMSRLSSVFKAYANIDEKLKEALTGFDPTAEMHWTVTISRFEVRQGDRILRMIQRMDKPRKEMILFGDSTIQPEARKFQFYKMGASYYCQINLYLSVTNFYSILRKGMVPVFIMDAILVLLFGIGMGFSIRTLWVQHRIHELQVDFLNGVSHEFNTPLAAIKLGSQTIIKLDREQNPGKIREIAGRILSQEEYLKKTVDQILNAAISEDPRVSVERSWVSAYNLLDEICKNWYQTNPKESVTIHKGEIENALIFVDPQFFNVAIHNLLDNAVRYVGQHQPVIEIRGTLNKNRYLLSIKDNGSGIQKKDLRHIFRKFYRGNVATGQKKRGLGLGLYLVRLILHLHEGSVKIKSVPGEGTEIILEIRGKHEK